MPNVTSQSTPDALRKHLEGIARSSLRISPALSQAVRSLLTAMDYADQHLIDSYLNSTAEAFRDLIQDTVRRHLDESDALQQYLHMTLHELCLCTESLDQFGKEITSLLDERVETLKSLRDGPVKDMATAYPIANASDLDQGIKELEKVKKRLLDDWPWSNGPLPPVDRKMVAESRAAIARGEKGESKEELMRRLGANLPAKSRD